MAENLGPRQTIKGLLEAVAPPRPLFLPIVFSHGAAIENLPLRSFLANPTKISNSLRQIRAHLRSDGIACYFDPSLETEEFGGVLYPAPGQLPDQGGSLAEPRRGSRVNVAVEVIRRLKSVVPDDCLLTAGISGPLTLAASLSPLHSNDALGYGRFMTAALDRASTVTSLLARAFAEAGADVIFIREDVLPKLSADECADWVSRLGTAINIIRFYQALPVLLLTHGPSIRTNRDAIFGERWDCVVCPAWDPTLPQDWAEFGVGGSARFGVALPPEIFRADLSGASILDERLRRDLCEMRPAVITTTTDLGSAADVERLNKLWENVRR
jgi:Uroporphyrinogen decarboxylase (URO-D)